MTTRVLASRPRPAPVAPGVGGETRIYGRNSHSRRKSIDDQIAEGMEDCAELGGEWAAPTVTSDGGSASKYGKKIRVNWRKNLADVKAGNVRRLWLWESSRGDRQASQWLAFLELCEQMGVLIRVGNHGRTYNLSNHRDWKALAVDGIENDHEARKISAGVKRGLKHSAIDGRPHASTTFGYLRVYHPRSRAYLHQELDEEQRTSPLGVKWSPAGVVREVKIRFLGDETLTAIAESLNRRGIPAPRLFASLERPTPKGPERWAHVRWNKQTLRRILLNAAYLGLRVLNGIEAKAEAWPALFTQGEYAELVDRLQDPARTTVPEPHSGREPKYLLSYLARCGACGAWMTRSKPRYEGQREGYRCGSPRSCASVPRPALEAYVSGWFLRWLTAPGRLESLDGSDEQVPAGVVEARAQVRRLEGDLRELRRATEDPRQSLDAETLLTFGRRRANLEAALAEARAGARVAIQGSALRRFAGLTVKQAVTLWTGDGLDLDDRRAILREVMEVRVLPVGKGRRNVPVDDRRVTIDPLR